MVIHGWSWLISKRSAINKFIIQQSVNQWQRFYFISFVICRFYLDCLPILSIFSSCTQLRMFTFLKLLLAYPFLVQWRILRCKRTSNQQHLSEGKKVLWKHTQRDMQTVQIIFDSLSSNGMINTICKRWKSKCRRKKTYSSSNMMKQSRNSTNSHNNRQSRRWNSTFHLNTKFGQLVCLQNAKKRRIETHFSASGRMQTVHKINCLHWMYVNFIMWLMFDHSIAGFLPIFFFHLVFRPSIMAVICVYSHEKCADCIEATTRKNKSYANKK